MAVPPLGARITVANRTIIPDPHDSGREIEHISDRGGNRLTLQLFQGKYYMIYYKPSVLGGIRNLRLRDDDIYFPSFLRTGTHWTFEMINMLLNGKAETIPRPLARNHIETATAQDLEALPAPRVVCAHMTLSDAPKQLLQKRCKIVYMLRDPKDVAVSLYHLYKDLVHHEYKGEFHDFIYLFLEGKVDVNGIFHHMKDAEKFFDEHPEIPVHFQAYEDAIKNPVQEIQKLSDFLGLDRNDDLCQATAKKCEFSRFKVDKDDYTLKVDGRAVLFRKGTVGDWKNWFTAEMLEDYYRVYDEKMAGSRFYGRYARGKQV